MYLYVHGFNSDVRSRSYLDLCGILDNIFALGYDYTKNANVCFAQLCEQVESYLNVDKNIKILGSSLGGFWGIHLAKEYDLPSLLFNPVTFAHEQLRPLLGVNQNFYSQEKWILTNEILISYADFILNKNLAIKPQIILGDQDELLDYTIALKYWEKDAHCIITHDFHSIMDYSQYKSLMTTL